MGHYCIAGTDAPARCENGQYQSLETQHECIECPAGYFCDNTMEIVVLDTDTVCPTGYYCPAGTNYNIEFPCPIGKFNNMTGNEYQVYLFIIYFLSVN